MRQSGPQREIGEGGEVHEPSSGFVESRGPGGKEGRGEGSGSSKRLVEWQRGRGGEVGSRKTWRWRAWGTLNQGGRGMSVGGGDAEYAEEQGPCI